MPDKTCPFCGRRFDASIQFCQDDGTPLALAAGTILAGRYEIVRELGRGAMGVVYLANEKDLGDRPCAIKILRVPPGTSRSEMADAVARLKREARMLGSLGSHPNLVTVYTAGQDDHGLSYIVMEYVEGETLKVKFARGTPFTVARSARIVRQMAQGLEHAHAQGVIHRDLKPGNLILTGVPESSGWVKIVDFGIAKAPGTDGSDLTMANHVVGTPRYMSPEQRIGAPLDPSSDVFSLALIAAELLSDERVEAEPGPFTEVPVDVATWPEALKQVLARGLAPEPVNRFSSALEFADAFEAAVEGWDPDDEAADAMFGRADSSAGVGAGTPGPSTAAAPRGLEEGPPTPTWKRWVGAGVVGALGFAAWAAMTLGPGASPTESTSRDEARAPAESLATEPAVTLRDSTLNDSPLDDPASGTGPPPGILDEDAEGSTPIPVSDSPAATIETPPSSEDFGAAVAALRARVDPTDPDTTGLGQIVVEATGVIDAVGVPDTLVVEVRYLRAEARLMLGDESAACADLETIRAAGESSPWVAQRYSRAVAALLSLNCGATS